MKIFKKGKMLSKKTISIITVGILLVTGTVYASVTTYKNNKEEAKLETRERVYTVTKGNITAGVKGGGTLKFEGVKHNFEESVVIGEVFVKEGQSVKTGDKLLSISEKYLSDKLDELNKSLNQAQLALEQANGDKKSSLLSNNKAWNDRVQGSKSKYESQKREITDLISDFKNRLAMLINQIDEIRKQIEEGSGNNDELKAKEAALLSEKNSIQGELNSANKRLSNLEEDRKKELESEANEADSNNEINNIKINSSDRAISNAKEEVNKIEEEIYKINKLKESPILYAKVDGIVNAINNADGTPTKTEGSIVDIGESSKVTAEITISQNDIINISEGQEVKLEIATYQDEKFIGKVKSINLKPNTQGNSTTYSVTVELDKTDYKLLEGMTVNAQFIIKEVKNVVMLSNKAIVLRDGKQYVKLKNKDGSITEVNIQTGFSDGKNTEIISGLNEGDTVIIGG